MMALPIGANVRHRERHNAIGTVVRNPHGNRAPRGMAWVLWQGAAAPTLTSLRAVVYLRRRGPLSDIEQLERDFARSARVED